MQILNRQSCALIIRLKISLQLFAIKTKTQVQKPKMSFKSIEFIQYVNYFRDDERYACRMFLLFTEKKMSIYEMVWCIRLQYILPFKFLVI